jgi:serine/threonine protein kinase/formylglycine-generating enzyme required for sulfatase activity
MPSGTVDSICRDFETALRLGQRPLIEDYLHRTPESSRHIVFSSLLASEIKHIVIGKGVVALPDYLRRFVAFEDVIHAVFAEQSNSQDQSDETCELTTAFVQSPRAAPQDGPSRRFGEYELLTKLGEGGMGQVFKALHLPVNRIVALKLIRPDLLNGSSDQHDQLLARFRIEVLATAKLKHDNIVTIFDVGDYNGFHYFTMQFVEGKTLRAVLGDGPMVVRQAAECLQQIARAVASAHQQDPPVLHRDIKPHNIMIDSISGRAMLADFGLAKFAGGDQELTVSGVLGSPPYMSPEQAKDAKHVTAAADIYSLGATLYHALTGRPPFVAGSLSETLRQLIEQDPISPRNINPEVPRELDIICLKCLAKEPENRYHSAEALADDLDRWLNSKPILARRSSLLRKTWLWSKRRPSVAAAIFVVAATLFCAISIVGMQQLRSDRVVKESQSQRAQTLVATLINTRAVGVTDIIVELRGLERHAIPLLTAACDDTSSTANQRRRAACALATFGDVRCDVLLHDLDGATDNECEIILDALKRNTTDSIARLTKRFNETEQPRTRAQVAILLLHLDEREPARSMLSLTSDPTARMTFIQTVRGWHGSLADYKSLLLTEQSADFRSGMCAAIGPILKEELSGSQRNEIEEALEELYCTAPDGATHSASDWALRQLRKTPPVVIKRFPGIEGSWGGDSQRFVHQSRQNKSSNGNGALAIVNSLTGTKTDLGVEGFHATWRPKGSQIAYAKQNTDNVSEIWLIEADGTNSRKVTEGLLPRWSFDGRQIYFTRAPEFATWILSITEEQAAPRIILRSHPRAIVAPDGQKAAAIRNGNLLIVSTADEKVLHSSEFTGWKALRGDWSADSEKFLFGGYGLAEARGMWLFRMDTGTASLVLPGSATGPAWSPDGKKICFTDLEAVETCVAEWDQVLAVGAGPKLPNLKEVGRPSNDLPSHREWHVNSLGMTLVRIPRGTFLRQTLQSEKHVVTLSNPFWLSSREVSVDQYQRYIDEKYPNSRHGINTKYSPTGTYPIGFMSWDRAILFCNWLSEREGLEPCYKVSGRDWFNQTVSDTVNAPPFNAQFSPQATGYRLPTEAEWEYACRAGTGTAFGSGNNTTFYREYAVLDESAPFPCGTRMPNGWGLFDMIGNVTEHCWDPMSAIESDDVSDPLGPSIGTYRVQRGGSFEDKQDMRKPATISGVAYPDGFRLARNDPSFLPSSPSFSAPVIVETLEAVGSIDEQIDLIRFIDLQRDKIAGAWQRLGDDLVVTVASDLFSRVEVPVMPSAEYDLEVEATRIEGHQELIIGLVYQGRSVGVVVDGWDGKESGLSVDNGPGGGIARSEGTRITNGKRVKVSCQVRAEQLKVLVDDIEVVRYQGKPTWNTIIRQWGAKNNDCLVLGAMNSTFRFHSCRMTPISGQAQRRYHYSKPAVAAYAADGSIYLDDYPESQAKLGYGALGKRGATGFPRIETHGSYDPANFRVGGKNYSHALAMHPPANVKYELGGKFRTFSVVAAIMDQVKPEAFKGELAFSVIGDGRPLWNSERLAKHGQRQPATINIEGVSQLQLVVTPHKDIQWGWAVWLEPKISP